LSERHRFDHRRRSAQHAETERSVACGRVARESPVKRPISEYQVCARCFCDAACAGIGITSAFAYHFQTALERGALTTLLDEFQPAALPVNLVYTANRFLPIKVRAFLDFAAPRLKRAFEDL
jgi:DNA-binding transcriptional LysR family regulator